MLLNTELSITEISEKVGYEEFHYFSRVFKNQNQIISDTGKI